jgi:hypothetical protein
VTGTIGGGVPNGDLLIAFAEAVLGEHDSALTRARGALAASLGPATLADAAAVVGLFNAIDRVADAIGIPLEDEKAAASANFRAALGLDPLLCCRTGLKRVSGSADPTGRSAAGLS